MKFEDVAIFFVCFSILTTKNLRVVAVGFRVAKES
jgi:hypothetical protein